MERSEATKVQDHEQEAELCSSEPKSARLSKMRPAFYYIMGMLTLSAVALFMAAFVIHRVGLLELKWKLFRIKSEPSYQQVMVLPKGILTELIARKAVIENAGNPTVQERHNTVLSIKDDDLGYILRPNVAVEAHTLRTTKAHNWEPPVR